LGRGDAPAGGTAVNGEDDVSNQRKKVRTRKRQKKKVRQRGSLLRGDAKSAAAQRKKKK